MKQTTMERSASNRVMVRRGRRARSARSACTAAEPEAELALEEAGMNVVNPASTIRKSNTFQGPLQGQRGRSGCWALGWLNKTGQR